ncbi:ABC transporter ATP-binding protein [Streptomyces sp. ICBB 8177]|uniref:ABC transporter ATP-binding protein n=1 Tax=Streptomyces sp. ICBB 8177 TaxID=563922 RepID=UPI0013051A55|nr:ABC transporter ATP-binding protein [Streptomyces sp. ICBB 8177]
MLGAVCLLALGSGGEVVSVWLFKDLVDNVLVPRRLGGFWPLAVGMTAVTAVAALLTFAGDYTARRVAEGFVLRLRTSCVERLHTLPPDTLRARWHGDTVARLTSDVSSVEEFAVSGVIDGASAVISLTVFTAAAFVLSWQLALAVLVTAPVLWWSAHYFGDRIQERSREARCREGRVTAVVEESLANASVAHAYNQRRREVDRVRAEGLGLMRAQLSTVRIAGLYPAVLEVAEVAGGLVVVGVGAIEMVHGQLTLGGLLAFAAFLTQVFGPATELSSLVGEFAEASGSAERVLEIDRLRSPVRERPGAVTLPSVRGELECSDLRASYPAKSGAPLLDGLAFRMAPGEVLAVTGPSGAGKSTLGKLLVRFMDPDTGCIRVDGVDLRDMTLESVRRAVTLLPQSSLVFRASVRDNIAYGRPGASDEEIAWAARAADADGFVRALPHGYATVLGQDGLQLSGGQNRRIALARAFLRAGAILVLDEPTAGLDRTAASRLMTPLRRLMSGRTTVLITHDPDLAGQADTVIALGQGDDDMAGRPCHLT